MSEGFWTDVIQNYGLYVAIITSIISGIIVFHKKCAMPLIRNFRIYDETIIKINKIYNELTPNGGTSIKDKINNIDKKVDIIKQVQHVMVADHRNMLFRTDPKGDCVWVNRTYTKTVGKTLFEVLGHGWQNVIAKEYREKVSREWYLAVEEKREFLMETKFINSAGLEIPTRVRSYKMVNSKGEVIGFWGNCEILRK